MISNKITPLPYDEEMNNAKTLLKDGEAKVPDAVWSVLRLCCDKGTGLILSRNAEAKSCRDACNKRNRLGRIGIPLHDELKSILFKGIDVNSNEKIVMAHCQGHKEVDIDALVDICDFAQAPEIMCEEEMLTRFEMAYGTVNPFLVESRWHGEVIHVFDEVLLQPMTRPPYTMMTNAGNHTWGIEFDPNNLVPCVDSSLVGRIAKQAWTAQNITTSRPKHIGIITGNGPDSGIALWKNINKKIVESYGDDFSGDISLPRVTVVSLPDMGLSMELIKRENTVWEALSKVVKQLALLEVDLLALACHTTHYFTDKIRSIFERDGKKFVSMAEATIEHVQESQISDIAILGIDSVANLQKYSAYSSLSSLNVEKIPNETLQRFRSLGYEVKQMQNSHSAFQRFISLLKKEVHSDNVIIALTELSVLWERRKKNWETTKIVIDPLDIYAKRIAAEFKEDF